MYASEATQSLPAPSSKEAMSGPSPSQRPPLRQPVHRLPVVRAPVGDHHRRVIVPSSVAPGLVHHHGPLPPSVPFAPASPTNLVSSQTVLAAVTMHQQESSTAFDDMRAILADLQQQVHDLQQGQATQLQKISDWTKDLIKRFIDSQDQSSRKIVDIFDALGGTNAHSLRKTLSDVDHNVAEIRERLDDPYGGMHSFF
jgi:soluble cytochrome b562